MQQIKIVLIKRIATKRAPSLAIHVGYLQNVFLIIWVENTAGTIRATKFLESNGSEGRIMLWLLDHAKNVTSDTERRTQVLKFAIGSRESSEEPDEIQKY